MEKQILQVKQFTEAYTGKEVPLDSIWPSDKERELRYNLMLEELNEYKDATTQLEAADAIIDQLYILLGTAHSHGLGGWLVQLFDEVHRSNMSKIPDDGVCKFREDGKLLKPSTYSPPNLEPILNRKLGMYRSLEAEAVELEVKERILLEQKVKSTIGSVLKKKDPLLHKDYKLYLQLEKRLSDKVKTVWLGGGVNEQRVEVDVLGLKKLVQLDFSGPKVGGVRQPKKATKNEVSSK